MLRHVKQTLNLSCKVYTIQRRAHFTATAIQSGRGNRPAQCTRSSSPPKLLNAQGIWYEPHKTDLLLMYSIGLVQVEVR
jgi:hypothetical protein